MCVRSHSLHRGFSPSFCSHLWLENSFLWDAVLCIVGCWHPSLYLLSADNISGLHRCSHENIQRYRTFHCYLGFLRVQSISLEKNCMLDPEVNLGIPSWEVLADRTSGWVTLGTADHCVLMQTAEVGTMEKGSFFSCCLWMALATLLSLLLHFLSSLRNQERVAGSC